MKWKRTFWVTELKILDRIRGISRQTNPTLDIILLFTILKMENVYHIREGSRNVDHH
jgi:hypothetical protein